MCSTICAVALSSCKTPRMCKQAFAWLRLVFSCGLSFSKTAGPYKQAFAWLRLVLGALPPRVEGVRKCQHRPVRVALWSLLGCIDTRRGAATHVDADQLRSLTWLPVSALVYFPWCVHMHVLKEWPLFHLSSMLPYGYILISIFTHTSINKKTLNACQTFKSFFKHSRTLHG